MVLEENLERSSVATMTFFLCVLIDKETELSGAGLLRDLARTVRVVGIATNCAGVCLWKLLDTERLFADYMYGCRHGSSRITGRVTYTMQRCVTVC